MRGSARPSWPAQTLESPCDSCVRKFSSITKSSHAESDRVPSTLIRHQGHSGGALGQLTCIFWHLRTHPHANISATTTTNASRKKFRTRVKSTVTPWYQKPPTCCSGPHPLTPILLGQRPGTWASLDLPLPILTPTPHQWDRAGEVECEIQRWNFLASKSCIRQQVVSQLSRASGLEWCCYVPMLFSTACCVMYVWCAVH